MKKLLIIATLFFSADLIALYSVSAWAAEPLTAGDIIHFRNGSAVLLKADDDICAGSPNGYGKVFSDSITHVFIPIEDFIQRDLTITLRNEGVCCSTLKYDASQDAIRCDTATGLTSSVVKSYRRAGQRMKLLRVESCDRSSNRCTLLYSKPTKKIQ